MLLSILKSSLYHSNIPNIRCVVCKRRYKRAKQGMSKNTAIRITTDMAGEGYQEGGLKETVVHYNIEKKSKDVASSSAIKHEHTKTHNLPQKENSSGYTYIVSNTVDDEHEYDTPHVCFGH